MTTLEIVLLVILGIIVVLYLVGVVWFALKDIGSSKRKYVLRIILGFPLISLFAIVMFPMILVYGFTDFLKKGK